MSHAVQALRAGKGGRLLVTGGLGAHPPAEAQVMRQLALDAGVQPAQILVEDQATSTFQSAVYCARILRQHGWSTALVVTDRYHLPRALLVFRGLGIRALGSAPRHGRYSQRLWKRWYYRAREVLAFAWYVLLVIAQKVRRHARDSGPTWPP
jgi:uncharacterized SAM-binding protein YcdF (DUF218 family)